MTQSLVKLERSPPSRAAPPETRLTRELPPLLVLAGLLAGACAGHFVKPHADFHEFRETGHALLRGELPPSFKRAPVFPLIVAVTGTLLSMFLVPETPPDQLAASWVNAILLPCNTALAYLIGRRWFGSGARWVAVWVALLPIGLYCTAHVLAEPLLVGTILLTIWLAQRDSKWAYATAALATLTRYDAAGALIGVAVADLLHRRRRRAVAIRVAFAALPLAIWLVLTALTWETRSQDHYLRQIQERWSVDALWPLQVTLESVLGPDTLSLPVWAAEWEPRLRLAANYAVVVSAMLGAAVLLWRRDRAAVVTAAVFVGYVLAHAVFPFRSGFERFGYPAATLLLLAAGTGITVTAVSLAVHIRSPGVRWLLLAFVAVVVLGLAYGEASRLGRLLTIRPMWITSLPPLALVGVVLIWATAWRRWQPVTQRIVVLAALTLLTLLQVRLALPMLGDGRERINTVKAARWIRAHTRPTDGVLCDEPGLLRLHVRDRPAERFVGLGGIAAESWPDILTECRRRGIRYIIWHDQVFDEQGDYYIRKWRLERFAGLSSPDQVSGVAVAARYVNRPDLWILRILPD